MNKILIIPNTLKDADLSVTRLVLQKLKEFGLAALISEDFSTTLGDLAEYFSTYPSDADALLVIGGDGSVIEASRIAINLDIPLLGVNLGNLGYLSEVETDELDVLEKLTILTDAAKYDAACTSSGGDRTSKKGYIGNTSSS